MNQEKVKIRSFTDLDAWKEGHIVVLLVYKITKTFPRDELFGLVSQMRRAAISITSNIAEGFSRQSYREKIQFYSFSLGSTTELQNQLYVAKDVKLINEQSFNDLDQQIIKVNKIINGLIKKSRAIIHDS